MVWRAIVRSSIGTSHQKRQIPCQDYGQYLIANDLVIGAVADGAGSARYAEVGAELAVKTALFNLDAWVKRNKVFLPIAELEARVLFSWVLATIVTELKAEAASRGCLLSDMACTLMTFIAAPGWIAAAQVGDGFIVTGCRANQYQLLFQPTKGEFINETTFVTAANAEQEMQVCVRLEEQTFLCVATDGLERVALQLQEWLPFARFFQPLQDFMWTTSSPEQEDEYICNFLTSERLNARTDDDKTLLLCVYDRP